MGEAQLPGVECLAIQRRLRLANRRRQIAGSPIKRIGEDRVSGLGQVDAYLMRAASLEVDFEERRPLQAFLHPIKRERRLSGFGL